MSPLLVVARREYRETVRRPAFVIWTVLTPLLFGGLLSIPTLMLRGTQAEQHVLILDGSGEELGAGVEEALAPAPIPPASTGDAAPPPSMGEPAPALRIAIQETTLDAAGRKQAAEERVRSRDVDVVLALPPGLLAGSAEATYYSRTATDMLTRQALGSALNRAVLERRVRDRGVPADQVRKLLERPRMEVQQVLRNSEAKRGGDADLLLALAFAGMLLLPTLLHGVNMMRGIVQEKSDRIVESLVSSMSAFELLTGKVVGTAAVGLTQIAIWSAMGSAVSLAFSGPLLAIGVHALDLVKPAKLAWFAVFFLLGYLTNACIFAMGGAAANTEKDAQHLTQPIMFVLMLPWFLIFPIVTSPDSPLATTLSLIPVYTPFTMFVRIVVGEPPILEVLLSIVLSLLSIGGLFWFASRVYRVGILWYGKQPSLPEFLRWVRQA